MGVCRGPFHPELIDVWDMWDLENDSENDRPGTVICYQSVHDKRLFHNASRVLQEDIMYNDADLQFNLPFVLIT